MANNDISWIFGTLAFIFGLLFGSFLNVCIYRLPRGLSVVSPGSACPNCNHPIAAYDNIPVLSWLLLQGKCRNCKAAITPRYAMVELITGAFFLLSYISFGGVTLATLKGMVFCFLVIGLIFTDFETHLLPDAMTLPGLGLGLVFSWFVPVSDLLERLAAPSVFSAWWQSPRVLSLADALIGALLGAGFIYGAGALYKLARGIEGMGFGDVKLMAMVGSFLGARLTLFVIFLASLSGAVFGAVALMLIFRKRHARLTARKHPHARQRAWQSASLALRFLEIPFGVFLGSAALLALFTGTSILNWYVGLF